MLETLVEARARLRAVAMGEHLEEPEGGE